MTSPEDLRLLAQAVTFGGWRWTGNETLIDLITAATNALNGALLARHLTATSSSPSSASS